ncbi:MAG: family 1 glycosylhydrolase, partial [Salibacteraceae bacterium]
MSIKIMGESIDTPKAQHYSKSDFGEDFIWGISSSAYQTEGAHNLDGKGPSIWDEFTSRKGRINKNCNANDACLFYFKFE